MTNLTKAGIAITGLGALGGGAALANNLLSKPEEKTKAPTIREKLKDTLLTSNPEDTEKWTKRATTLQSDNGLSPSLELIKTQKDDSGAKLRDWCDLTSKNTFNKEEDKLFKEVQKYCVYNIKEKIGKAIEISQWKNDTHDKKLKENTGNKPLSTTMTEIKAKIEASSSPDKDALKTWCGKAYEMVFKGDNDQDFKDAKEYCTTN